MCRHQEESLAFGGQALIEGVMIRSQSYLVMCVRQNNATIITKKEKINSLIQIHNVLEFPFLRGVAALFETMYLGIKGISFSANIALEEEEEEISLKEWFIIAILTFAISSLFFIIPFLLTNMLNLTGILFSIVEAGIRLGIFLLYISIISIWSDFRRVLQYHGAEHKAINAYEAGESLVVANVKRFSRLHRRCGTSFLLIVIIVSIILFSIMPGVGLAIRLVYRVVMIPVIGAISYEILRLSKKYDESKIIRLLTTPGLLFQRLTTREPDDSMIEVAIKAVEEAVRISELQNK